jgi:hypothetical protein
MIFLLGSFFCSTQQSSASQSDKTRIAVFNRKSPLKESKPIRDSLFLALTAFAKERNINLIINTAGTFVAGLTGGAIWRR